jgi:hypothetical protein
MSALDNGINKVITNGTKEKTGHVYLIESSCKKKIKIGRSVDPKSRTRGLLAISGGGEVLYVSEKLELPNLVEKSLHKYFERYRVYGEWFCIKKEDAINKINEFAEHLKNNNDGIKFAKVETNKRLAINYQKLCKKWSGMTIVNSPVNDPRTTLTLNEQEAFILAALKSINELCPDALENLSELSVSHSERPSIEWCWF